MARDDSRDDERDLMAHGSSGSREASFERTSAEEALDRQPFITSLGSQPRRQARVPAESSTWTALHSCEGICRRRPLLLLAMATVAAGCLALVGAWFSAAGAARRGAVTRASHMRGFESKEEMGSGQDAFDDAARVPDDLFAHLAGEIRDRVEAETWEVVNYDWLHVHQGTTPDAAVVGTEWKCNILVGVRQGDWVKLVYQAGYVRRMVGDTTVLRSISATYGFADKGKACSDVSMYPITDADMCGLGARHLGLAQPTSGVAVQPIPAGCREQGDGTWWWEAIDGEAQALCSTVVPCTPATTTSSTSSTSTSATTTSSSTSTTTWTWTSTSTQSWSFPFPSLFCFSVTRTTGYEPELMRAMHQKNIGIFACEDWSVLTDGGSIKIGTYKTPAIHVDKVSIGDLHDNGVTTTSWLNTMIFMKAWEIIGKDNRFRAHDWVVKVDPDAVFFANRLKRIVTPISMAHKGGKPPSLFLNNCDLYRDKGWSTFFGSLEVFTTAAIEAYLFGWKGCKKHLKWHGWGEDLFISSCMNYLGVKHVNEFGMLSDRRCYVDPSCSDHSKVAFHYFKNVDSYMSCWRNATAPVNFHIREDLKALDKAQQSSELALKN
jgi:hypothetical protein